MEVDGVVFYTLIFQVAGIKKESANYILGFPYMFVLKHLSINWACKSQHSK